uniref:Putative secreted protein n=1 Tax=Ixodes scapularis TaxID=6945 RepID=A0A4D5REB1_IXOSC
MFMGALVPTLMALMRQLHSQPTLKFSSSLADTVKIAVMSRFSEDLRSDELLLATAVHPNLKFHGLMKRRKRILGFLKRNITHCALPRKLHGSQHAMTTTTTTPSCDCALMLNLPVKHSNRRLTPHQRRRYPASTNFPALRRCFYASMPHFLLAHLSNVFSARGGRF